jgi:hypothetical protein
MTIRMQETTIITFLLLHTDYQVNGVISSDIIPRSAAAALRGISIH